MDNETKNRLSGPRAALSALARRAPGGLITVAEAADALGVDPRLASSHLNRLMAAGWLARARRGLYYVLPLDSANAESTTVEDPWVLAAKLLSPCYIGGWSAAEHWQLTEQLFRETFVVTSAGARTRTRNVLGAEFHIVRVPRARVSGFAKVWRGAVRVPVSDRERTIADALNSPEWIGGVRHLVEMLTTYRNSEHFSPAKLLARMAEINKGAAYKRLGFIYEQLFSPDEVIVRHCLERRSAGVIKLDPGVGVRGKIHKRWGLSANVQVEAS